MNITELVNYIASNGGAVELPDGRKVEVTLVEPANPLDTPDIIGKWVRCVDDTGGQPNLTKNKWYKIMKNPIIYDAAFINNAGREDGWSNNEMHFDLTNALDYNPEELVGKWYEGRKIEGIKIKDFGVPWFKLSPTSNALIDYPYTLCLNIDISKVTDATPTKSLKYEDVVKEVKPRWYLDSIGEANDIGDSTAPNEVPTESDAKSVLAYYQLLVVMKAANGEWKAGKKEISYSIEFNREENKLEVVESGVYSPLINFRTRELAEQALKDNEQIFKDFYQIA